MLPASTSPRSNFFLTCPAFSLKPSSPVFLAVYCWVCAFHWSVINLSRSTPMEKTSHSFLSGYRSPLGVGLGLACHYSGVNCYEFICATALRCLENMVSSQSPATRDSYSLSAWMEKFIVIALEVLGRRVHMGDFSRLPPCSSVCQTQSSLESYHEENSNRNDRNIFFFWAVNLSVGKSYSIDLISCVYLSSDDT